MLSFTKLPLLNIVQFLLEPFLILLVGIVFLSTRIGLIFIGRSVGIWFMGIIRWSTLDLLERNAVIMNLGENKVLSTNISSIGNKLHLLINCLIFYFLFCLHFYNVNISTRTWWFLFSRFRLRVRNGSMNCNAGWIAIESIGMIIILASLCWDNK